MRDSHIHNGKCIQVVLVAVHCFKQEGCGLESHKFVNTCFQYLIANYYPLWQLSILYSSPNI